MTFRTLIRRSLRFHWRAHLGVVLGAAIGSAALIGALVVGDSVKASLWQQALRRLGKIQFALHAGDRTFTDQLAARMPSDLKDSWREDEGDTWVYFSGGPAAALVLPAMAIRQDDGGRANQIQLIGVVQQPAAERGNHYYELWSYADWRDKPVLPAGQVLLNAALAAQLQARVGDQVIFRVQKPGALSADVALSPRNENSVSLRLQVTGIVLGEALGDFSLRATTTPVLNAFVNLDEMQKATGLQGRANLIVSGGIAVAPERLPRKIHDSVRSVAGEEMAALAANQFPIIRGRDVVTATQEFQEALQQSVELNDYEAEARIRQGLHCVDLISRRVFLEPPIVRGALTLATNENHASLGQEGSPAETGLQLWAVNGARLLTYLASSLQAGTNATPYSMVTAAGAPWTSADMRDDEILVNQWLADDLRVKPGDEMSLVYFDPESGARLVERTNTFRIRAIVPMEMPWADRTLMPDFPGIEKAESTSDWDAGFPLVRKIRDQDEDYWKQHRGTPKAFITLAAGQKMWANRFGDLTAIRFPIPTNALPLTPALSPGERENRPQPQSNRESADSSTALGQSKSAQRLPPLPTGEGRGEGEVSGQTNRFETASVTAYKEALEEKILANLKPEDLGLRFEPVREQALKAAEQSQDFGGLFLGFSFFLIIAALLLMAMLFQFGLEQRTAEIGTLLALGFTPRQVRRLLLGEGVALAFIGGLLGALGGLAYAKVMLHGLATIWRDAVGASALSFHATPQTLAIGLFASTAVGGITIWLALRKFVRIPARALLVGDLGCGDLSALSAGDLSPSAGMVRESWFDRVALVLRRAAGRGAAWTTCRPSGESGVKPMHSKMVALAALALAVALVGWAVVTGNTANAGVFFGAGALVLIAGLAAVNAQLVRLAGSNVPTLTPALSLREREHHTQASSGGGTGGSLSMAEPSETERRLSPLPAGEGKDEGERHEVISLSALSFRGCARRRTRSLATVAMLACGSFLIVSIGVFRLDANRDASKRSSGTGGFALIGETTMPVVHDLNTESGRDFFALSERELGGVSFVPFRVREGDEASCLNLNRAQKPRLLGVKPELLDGRFSFVKGGDWRALPSGVGQASRLSPSEMNSEMSETGATPVVRDEIPAIGDANSIQWAMKKKVGDTIDYVDERGQPFKVRIVGGVANAILQGQLLIDEAEFVKRFPGERGYRMFLIDAPSNRVAEVSATLTRAMQDVGLELTPTAQRLAQFNAVQNTYLGTFQVLGGLGLLLGSVGLGIVVLRNVLERRGELAVLLAVGFRRPTLQRLLLMENGALLGLGLALGVLAAAVAVLPALLAPAAQLPDASLALTLGAVLVNGALWTWVATRFALRGNLLVALRNE